MRGHALATRFAMIPGLGLVALVLGAALGCYHDDYLLGALCYRESDCGEGQCCAGVRCRPEGDVCQRLIGEPVPYYTAYEPCDDDAQCIVHGQPLCARWADASVGFCTDLCVGDPARNCELHIDGFPLTSTPRTCVDVDGQSVCAIDCSEDPSCPPEMQCHQGVCVPTPAP